MYPYKNIWIYSSCKAMSETEIKIAKPTNRLYKSTKILLMVTNSYPQEVIPRMLQIISAL